MTEQVQEVVAPEMTKFSHNVSFVMETEVNMGAMDGVFTNFKESMDAKKEAGEELGPIEAELLALVEAGNVNGAVQRVIQLSFGEYLMGALSIAAQSVTDENQSTSFVNIAVEVA